MVHKKCMLEACKKFARNSGVCQKHGAAPVIHRKKYNVERCGKFEKNSGVCAEHGAIKKKKARCSKKGCEKQAKKAEMCRLHAGGRERGSCKYWIGDENYGRVCGKGCFGDYCCAHTEENMEKHREVCRKNRSKYYKPYDPQGRNY